MLDPAPKWTFLTNHAHVLLCLARCPNLRMRDIAVAVGITERAVQRIVADLRAEGYIQQRRQGRCNTYEVDMGRHLKHPLEAHRRIADLMGLILGSELGE